MTSRHGPALARVLLPGLLLAALALPGIALADPHTYVSGVGDDVNPCSRTAPCRTFAGAISKTDAGGVITPIDPFGFGTVTITKSITIDGNGVFAGVLAGGGGTNGIIVHAGPTDKVVLRGLTMDNVTPCTAGSAIHGIKFISGGSLHVENTSIRGFPGAAIDAELTADGSSLSIDHTDLRGNCTDGVSATTTTGHVAVNVADSMITNDITGIAAGAGAQVFMTQNTIVGNTTALATSGNGTISSFGDNRIAANTGAGVQPTELPTSPALAPEGPPTPQPAPPPAQTPAPPPIPFQSPPTCTVPNLNSMTLTEVKTALARTICELGTVSYGDKKGKPRQRVFFQLPAAGTVQYRGAVVNVTISRAAKRSSHKVAKAKGAALGGATRTWVSGVGDDANPCSRTAPCKTFAGAIQKTNLGGTLNSLDPGDFKPFTIKSTSNDGSVLVQGGAPGAEIVVPGGATGITVNDSGNEVTLRDLTIVSAVPCTAPGTGAGISLVAAGALHLEHVTLRGFAGSGIAIAPGADASVTVRDSTITDNCTTGVSAQRPGGNVSVTLDAVTLRGNATAVLADDGATVRLTDTTVSGNTVGLATNLSGVIQGWLDNHIFDNGSDGATPGMLAFE